MTVSIPASYHFQSRNEARARDRVPNFILSSKLVQPSWHVFVELLVIKFSMLIRGTAVRLRQPEQNTKIIEFKLP